jgi:hypothetical protein
MAVFKITHDSSVVVSGFLEFAFGAVTDDTPQADSLTVDAGAFLASQGVAGIGAFLAPTLGWKVTVNGSIFSLQYYGLYLQFGNTAVSTITVGAEGSIGGVDGIYLASAAIVKNSGEVTGSNYGIYIIDPGTRTIANSGQLSGGVFAIYDEAGLSTDKVTNKGTIVGDLSLGGGNDSLTNSGLIQDQIFLGAGNDVLTNTGFIGRTVETGDDNDTITNSGLMNNVDLGAGNDKVTNSGRIVTLDLGEGVNTVTNSKEINFVRGVGGDDTLINKGKVNASVRLDAGNNTITNSGSIGDDVETLSGNDVLVNSGIIVDRVFLGGGNNKITNSGTIGGDIAVGSGDDVVTNSGSVGSITLGDGNNTLTNTGDAFSIASGSGNDTIVNKGIVTLITTGAGNDVVTNTAVAIIETGEGDDSVIGGAKVETVVDSGGSDTYRLGAGNDVYDATSFVADGADLVDGGAGVDEYYAFFSTNAIVVNLDTIQHGVQEVDPFNGTTYAASTATGSNIALGNKDTVLGFENVTGGNGGDLIFGNSSANLLNGFVGNDDLLGYAGNDRLIGNSGDDRLYGGAGKDTLEGGPGADGFFYTAKTDSGTGRATRDTIVGFDDGQDYIALFAIDANAKTLGDDAFNFIGVNVKFGGNAGELRAYFSADGMMVEGDVNGDKKADFSIFIQDPTHTLNATTFTAADFIL